MMRTRKVGNGMHFFRRAKSDGDGLGLKYQETGTDPEDRLHRFQGTEIWMIVNTEGLVDEWIVLNKVSLVPGDNH